MFCISFPRRKAKKYSPTLFGAQKDLNALPSKYKAVGFYSA